MSAPKTAAISVNPLCRWSRRMQWSPRPSAEGFQLGMEGCGFAFNATSAMRACRYFDASPPRFLNAAGYDDVGRLGRHHEGPDGRVGSNGDDELCRFGPFPEDPSVPVVCLENFADRARPITDGYQFPERCMVIGGHENKGVSREWLDRAQDIVFIPQYGTISSLNVVTSAGIAAFHHHLSRLTRAATAEDARNAAAVVDLGADPAYTTTFSKSALLREDGKRIDPRPIHPSYFHLDNDGIGAAHEEHIRRLFGMPPSPAQQQAVPAVGGIGGLLPKQLQAFFGIAPAAAPPRVGGGAVPSSFEINDSPRRSNDIDDLFRFAVLYENDVDRRNLGGLVRNANSFLAPVFYSGRRKLNRQGAVGSEHFVPITYLGREAPDVEAALDRMDDHELWFLSCDQEHLLSADTDPRSLAALADLTTASVGPRAPVYLDAPDHVLRAVVAAARERCRRVVLVVPQESTLPSPHLMRRCRRIVKVASPFAVAPVAALPKELHVDVPDAALPQHRGLSSQVVSGIALHRLFNTLLYVMRGA